VHPQQKLLAPRKRAYSPTCVEVEFCELRLGMEFLEVRLSANSRKFPGLGPSGLRPFLFAVNLASWGRVSSGPHLQAWPFFLSLFTKYVEAELLGSSLRVDLLLDHRLCWPSGGYGVRVSVHYLLGALFRPKDARNPHAKRSDIFPSTNLCLAPLHLHNVGKLSTYVLR
jgi:hypothetical protein